MFKTTNLSSLNGVQVLGSVAFDSAGLKGLNDKSMEHDFNSKKEKFNSVHTLMDLMAEFDLFQLNP